MQKTPPTEPVESAKMPEVPVEPPKLLPPPPPMIEEVKEAKETKAMSETTSYTVQKGDSLSLICKRHHLKTAEVMALNGIKDPNKLRLGQKLILPGKLDVPAAPEAAATPARKSVKKPSVAKATAAGAAGGAYVVKSGDSLSKIAAQHGVKTAALRKANNLTGDVIRVGQKLVIPGKGAVEKAAATKAEPPAPAAAPAAVPVATPVEAAPAAAPEAAPVGDLQPVESAPAAAPAAAPTAGMREHTVDKGEDLYTVAMMYGVDVSELKKLNGLTDTALTPGQKLKIPVTE